MISHIPKLIRLQNHVRLMSAVFHPADTKTDMHGYLKEAWVLEALGVPVNFSYVSPAVVSAFQGTADIERGGSLEAVSYLLDSGVKVHMMYGDRDYACNWIGGEAISLGINYSSTENFKQAGYAPILTSTGTGGFVRQYGNYSFSRVFQAGHEGKQVISCTRFMF
jgi:carboxypeptidase C (cathepsin A)